MYLAAFGTILLLHSASHVKLPENILPFIFVNISYVGICSKFSLCVLVRFIVWDDTKRRHDSSDGVVSGLLARRPRRRGLVPGGC